MSVVRTAFRLSAIEALRADPVIDAQCGDRVFDSRIGEFDSEEPVPMITVFTEDDGGRAWNANNGGPPFDEHCELLLEIAMRGTVPAKGTAPALIGTAETDGSMEATLDFIEKRAVDAVTVSDTPQADLVRAITKRALEYKSIRFTSNETGAKLAVRMVHVSFQLHNFDPDDPRSPPTGPFASLPEPLRTVAGDMPAGSSGLAICQMLAGISAAACAPAVPPAMTGIDLMLAPVIALDPASPPIRPDDAHLGLANGNFGVTATTPTS